MARVIRALTLGLAVTGLSLAGLDGSAIARPVVPAEQHYEGYDNDLPACDDVGVLDRIASRFSRKESEYWNTSLEITHFDDVKLLAARPWGLDHIPRNFCTARVLLNDQSYHKVSYSVVEDGGMIGFGYGVEWCVEGLDRDLAYAPACQLARP